MSVRLYITHDPLTTQETPFEKPYEREASIIIARALWGCYRSHPKSFALIANPMRPQEPYKPWMDLVIVTRDGLGVVELKHADGPIEGDADTPWINEETGQTLLAGEHYRNPFQQVEAYRKRLKDELTSIRRLLPEWLEWGDFDLQNCLVFTGKNVDTSGIRLRPVYSSWFSMIGLHEVAGWADTLCFGRGHTLNDYDIANIAEHFFRAAEWKEITPHLTSAELYGRLYLIGKQSRVYDLTRDYLIVGREGDIAIPDAHIHVSRKHVAIRRTPHGVLLSDIGSANATWVNDRELEQGEEVFLKSADRITLGTRDARGRPSPESCELEFESVAARQSLPTEVLKDDQSAI